MPFPRVFFSALTSPALPRSVVPFDSPIEENIGMAPQMSAVAAMEEEIGGFGAGVDMGLVGAALSTAASAAVTETIFPFEQIVGSTVPTGFDAPSVDIGWNGTSNYSYADSNATNATTINYIMAFNGAMYPSEYSVARIAVTSIFVTALMVVVVVGNMLVIIAIATEKALKGLQFWFIGSLAVADFLLGLVIMPFSLASELMGYWVFGSWWCDIHSAIDVLLCTASICNICLISLDRYWSITQAVDYMRTRTPKRAAAMIAIVWLVAAGISLPPLLGWSHPQQEGDFPSCELSEDIGYVLYSALGSFYIPSFIMVMVYIRIFFAARDRARKNIQAKKLAMAAAAEKRQRNTNNAASSGGGGGNATTSVVVVRHEAGNSGAVSTITAGVINNHHPQDYGISPNDAPRATATGNQHRKIAAAPSSNGKSGPNADADDRLLKPKRSGGSGGKRHHHYHSPTCSTSSGGGPVTRCHSASSKRKFGCLPKKRRGSMSGLAGLTSKMGAQLGVAVMEQLSMPSTNLQEMADAISIGDFSEFDASSSSDFGNGAYCSSVVKPFRKCKALRSLCSKGASAERGDHMALSRLAAANRHITTAAVTIRDPEKEKRRIARQKEKRATFVLGLIVGAFILCWLPFFLLYVIQAICHDSCSIQEWGFATAFWLGYANSAFNPVIYTIFNKDFRNAFHKILCK